MNKLLIGIAALTIATPAVAQEQFPAELAAAFYMDAMSIPKGWVLSYKGRESGTYVYIMDRDLDAAPQTAFMEPIGQLRRLMCGDETLAAFIASGTVVRVDSRDKREGRSTLTKGPTLTSCG